MIIPRRATYPRCKQNEIGIQCTALTACRNPATLSEKQWHSLIRTNALLNGHRLVFTRAGTEIGDSVSLRFRRIERAPYTGTSIHIRQ
jgi:hypothetical protein